MTVGKKVELFKLYSTLLALSPKLPSPIKSGQGCFILFQYPNSNSNHETCFKVIIYIWYINSATRYILFSKKIQKLYVI